LTWKYRSTIFAVGGGYVKKEHLILILFVAVTAVSGVLIWILKVPEIETMASSQAMADQSEALREAIRQWEIDLADDPDDVDLLVKLGNGYFDINEPRKAIEYYERALKIKPDMPYVLADCGAMYRQIGRPEKAIEFFRKAIEIDPDLAQAYFNLGAVLMAEKNDPRGAARAWQKYLELTPNPDPRIRDLLMDEIEAALGGDTD
jgi:tetratricopeptide (TPR) repeat protein